MFFLFFKDSYILFICKYDPFIKEKKEGYGRSCYTFKTICLEESEVNLNDKSIKVVYNASAYKAEKDEKARALLHYIHTNEPAEDDFSKRLEDYVKKIKNSEKFRRDYAAMNLHDRDIMRLAKQEGLAEGITQGTQQKAIEAAEKALEMNLTVEQAAEITGLPLEQVLELKKQVTVNA
ncbi:MAG: Rpn family recombination-promoting nuclease/putative transposase [Treponema sp.]|uniref:Rpn family recombination-promoting nuclease/putative transposase n=1 Tax=Treponema sp. TaxID=166 RepID=UPI00298EBE9A|nr:Rpn family recombination-promoting nuclease/putative transposase [Treponema sp.]MCR5387224.1 Rpn family recombination-promoting nuclease/putative transposase [Treponema sp.]